MRKIVDYIIKEYRKLPEAACFVRLSENSEPTMAQIAQEMLSDMNWNVKLAKRSKKLDGGV